MFDDNLIDAHIHLWTLNSNAYPLASNSKAAATRPASFTLEEFLDHAGPVGVRRAVLVQSACYGFDHSYICGVIRQFPTRFAGVALIDENSTDLGKQLDELRAMGIVGVRLVMINRDADAWLDCRTTQLLLRLAEATHFAACFLCDPNALHAINRVCQQFPKLIIVIDHMARVGADGELNADQIRRLCGLAKHGGVYIKLSAFYALGNRTSPYCDLLPLIRQLRDAFGPERLMWGSDCPFQVAPGHGYTPSLDLLRKYADFLSNDERQQILQGTAQQVFFERAVER